VVHGLSPIVTLFVIKIFTISAGDTLCAMKKCVPKAFFGEGKVMLVLDLIKFFPPSTNFLWSNSLDNKNHFVLNSL